jgi:hypothetical protein
MKPSALPVFPQQRHHDLVVDELPDEVLVYDLERHQAHCLNSTAALVWKNCDGQTTPLEIAHRLEKELQAPCPEEVVWVALRELESLHLLEQPVIMPPQLAGLSRRQMVRGLVLAAAVAVPVVTSIVSPTPAHASSGGANGSPCSTPAQCNSNHCSVGGVCVP